MTLKIILVFTLTCGCVSAFDKYLHWPSVSVNFNNNNNNYYISIYIYIYIHCNMISVNDLHLH